MLIEGRRRVRAWELVARLREVGGEEARAESSYRRALDGYETRGDRVGAGNCCSGLGRIALRCGKLAEGERMHSLALDHYRASDEEHGVADAYWSLALVFWSNHDADRALLMLSQARRSEELFGRAEERFVEGAERLGLEAEIRCALGELERAESLFRRSLVLFEQRGRDLCAARERLGLAGVYLAEERVESALTIAREAQDTYRSAGHPVGIGWADLMIGRAYSLLDFGLAERHLFEALKAFVSEQDVLGEASALLWIAVVSGATGCRKRALAYFRRSHFLHEACRNVEGSAEVHLQIGLFYEAGGESEKAKDAFSQARVMFERCSSRGRVAVVDEALSFSARVDLVSGAGAVDLRGFQ